MTAPNVLPTWEAKLLATRDRLDQRAKDHVGHPQFAVLENNWEFAVIRDSVGLAYRFRRYNDRQVAWLDFLIGARKLARVLGAGDWKLLESERRAYFECTFIAPAPPAPPEAA